MIRTLFIGIFLCWNIAVQAQSSIHQYKYVIVPEAYSFLDSNDEYQLNTMTKFFFTKYGFETYMTGEQLPKALLNNGCAALRARVKKKSTIFNTRLTIELINCNEQVVFTSKEGVSNVKQYKRAYQDALRDAFQSVKELNYTYTPVKETETVPTPKVTPSVPEASTPAVTNEVPEAMIPAPTTTKDSGYTYLWKAKKVKLLAKDYGYLLQEITPEGALTLGKLYALSRPNHFILVAGVLSGSAFFDTKENVVLERIDPVSDTVLTEVLKRQ